MKLEYEVMLGLSAEMVLDEAIYHFKKDKLQEEIDQALEAGDKSLFYKLSSQLNTLQ